MARRAQAEADRLVIAPRFRVVAGRQIALGPGKAELLRRIGETGSIQQAAQQMDMSYMRAWTLVRTMNACFREPLVETARGGSRRGGAQLTDAGREVLALYLELEERAARAVRTPVARLRRLLQA